MPDIYATIADADPTVVENLAEVLEARAAEPAQQAMLEEYLAAVPFSDNSRVLEVGCGSGPIARKLASLPQVADVVGIDPSPVFVERARELGAGFTSLTFETADGREIPYPDATFDGVVIHTVLCHVPGPEDVLTEAYRVLRPGGWMAIFDGDYATTSVARSEFDPLQTCVMAAMANLVHDPWLAPRLPALVEAAGLRLMSFRGHSYVQTHEPTYLLSLVDRGTDFQTAAGEIGSDLANALKAEARRRVNAGEFYGLIVYTSLIAQRTN